jgi:pyruvate kinase
MNRHTKIVATLGPATDEPGVLDALIAAGLDCARMNCSHGNAEDVRRRTREVRAAAVRAGRPVAVMLDLQGPKIRLADIAPRAVQVGDELVFVEPGSREEPEDIRVELPGFISLVSERSQLVIGDGSPRFAVTRIHADRVHARALTSGSVLPRKGISVTHALPSLPAITAKDLVDLDLAVELDVDFVAQSFVRSADDVRKLRAILVERGSRARVIVKVEKVEAVEHIDEILDTCEGVMVARGDYGVEAGVEHVPVMQKHVIRSAVHAGKTVITATQMLESMLANAEPTRAEASDVANAVIDGTSAVMLSAETSVGQHPVEAVRWMAKIVVAAEEGLGTVKAGQSDRGDEQKRAVMRAAVDLATRNGAAALVVPTSSGGSVRACSTYRPSVPIVALAHDPRVAQELALEWGVIPSTLAAPSSVDELINRAIEKAARVGSLSQGDAVVLTAGNTGERGTTNLIVVRDVPSDAESVAEAAGAASINSWPAPVTASPIT